MRVVKASGEAFRYIINTAGGSGLTAPEGRNVQELKAGDAAMAVLCANSKLSIWLADKWFAQGNARFIAWASLLGEPNHCVDTLGERIQPSVNIANRPSP